MIYFGENKDLTVLPLKQIKQRYLYTTQKRKFGLHLQND